MRGGARLPRRPAALSAALLALATVGALLLSACIPLLPLPPRQVATPDADFSDYTEQVPRWTECGEEILCADIFAPLDWSEPEGERITLRLVKHPAESGSPLGTLFVNPGGPGASGASYIADYVDGAVAAPVRAQYDVIGWDPRGVGGSSAVVCLDDAGLDDFLYGTGDPEADGAFLEFGSDAWIERGIEDSVAFGEACLENTGELLGHVDTVSTVRDLDMLRAIVGDERLNYLGYSYGTQIGALYAELFPEQVGRLVLDGAVDPAATLQEVTQVQAVGIEGAMRAYVTDCLARSGCPLSELGAGDVDRGMEIIDGLLRRVEAEPIRAADGRMLYDSTLFTAIVTTLYSQSLWPELDTLIDEVARGGAEQAFRLADYYNDRVDGVYQSNLMEAFAAINCLDYPRVSELDFDELRRDAEVLMAVAPIAGRFQSFGDVGCANWPVPAADVARAVTGAGAAPILVIGTTGDPATPYRWAKALAGQLESGVLVTFEGEGHTAYGQSECIDAIVDDYFLSGAVPQGDAVCS